MTEGSLSDLSFPEVTRTSSHRLGRDFLAQCLLRSSFYRRAVGFFSSSVFRVARDEWIRFFRTAGRAQFVISPHLSRRDIRALREAIYERPAYSKGFFLEDYDGPNTKQAIVEGDFLRGLVATDRVEVRVALRTGWQATEIYHEKIGIFSDHEGSILAFSGSANESWSAYIGNFERIDIFRGSEERRRALAVERNFKDLWNNNTDGVEVLRLYEALRQNVLLERAETSVEWRDELVDEKQGAAGRSIKSYSEVLVPGIWDRTSRTSAGRNSGVGESRRAWGARDGDWCWKDDYRSDTRIAAVRYSWPPFCDFDHRSAHPPGGSMAKRCEIIRVEPYSLCGTMGVVVSGSRKRNR